MRDTWHGARISVAAPAGPVDPESLEAGRQSLEGLGFEVVYRDDILDRDGYLAGSDDRRAAEDVVNTARRLRTA